MRIGGLASGMDIDSLVSDLMKAERIPLDKLKQKKQVLQWQRDDYRSMNTLLLNFRSELTNMKLSATYRSRGTSSTDESKVTATATSAASLASYSISKVTQLASAASKVNTASISKSGGKVDLSKSLAEAEGQFATSITWKTDGVAESQSITAGAEGKTFKLTLRDGITVQTGSGVNVKVNGSTYNVVSSFSTDTSKNEVMIDQDGNLTFNKNISKNSSIKVDYIASHRVQELTLSSASNTFTLSTEAKNSNSIVSTIKVTTDGTAVNYTVNSNKEIFDGTTKVGSIDADGKVTFDNEIAQGAKVEVNYQQKYSSFSIKTYGANIQANLEYFHVSASESLNTVINKVNTSNVGVTMLYDSVSDKMTLTRKETGDFNKLPENTTATEENSHEIITNGEFIDNVLNFADAAEIGGTNAKFTINGLETERTSNTFELSGVTFTLKKLFSDTPASINITNNTNQIYDNIKGFVDKYNELISKIQGEVQEERFKDYTPLTDEQRESLSDKQQELWEEKAKSGLLRRDPTLTSALNKMRSDFGNPVANSGLSSIYKQLSSIGITTTSNYLEGGKLEIDEAALKKAIEADPTSVEKLFTSTGSSTSEKGIIERLSVTVTETLDKLRSKAGNSFTSTKQYEIGKLLDDIDSRISRFEDRLTTVEDRYWTQFTAMEKAIQRSNEQMTQLSSYFA